MAIATARRLLSFHLCPVRLTNLIKRGLITTTMERVDAIPWQTEVQSLDPKQVEHYHTEQLIMVDENDTALGPISKGESHSIETVRKSIYHRALSLLIFDEQDRFLLTQRAACKITFPNYFTNACCSHPLYKDQELEDDGDAIGVKRAVIRRSIFELGLKESDLSLAELKFVNKLAYRAVSDGGKWGEAEIDYIFILKKNVELRPNPEEVQSYRYVTRSEMRELLTKQEEKDVRITPWVKLLGRELLFKYWDNLQNLDKVAQPQTIINFKNLCPDC